MTREQAIKVLKDWDGYFIGHSSDDVCDALEMAIKALEQEPSSSENPNKWIPCSKRLPEVGQRVIATIESIDGNYVRDTIYDKHGFLCGKCIAWCELPEPYQPEIQTGVESEEVK